MSDHNYVKKSFMAQEKSENALLKEGLNRTKAQIKDGKKFGRDWYVFREIINGRKRHFRFCVDYDGYINEVVLEEEDV